MPRALGQIDVRKNEAILDAAVEIFAERGVAAPIEAVARRAGVSKQTVYNHYRSKADLMRTLIDRRRGKITAVLCQPAAGRPEETLGIYAAALLEALLTPSSLDILRVAVSGSRDAPDIARALYEAGPKTARSKLSEFLAAEAKAGRLAIDNPDEAAELFLGMVSGARQLSALLGVAESLDSAGLEKRARVCAARFVKAYAPDALI